MSYSSMISECHSREVRTVSTVLFSRHGMPDSLLRDVFPRCATNGGDSICHDGISVEMVLTLLSMNYSHPFSSSKILG